MLSASVMKMIKKSESVREKSSVKKKKLREKYKRSLTEEISSDTNEKIIDHHSGGQTFDNSETATSRQEADLESFKSKMDLLKKRFSQVNLLTGTGVSQAIDPEVACEFLKSSLVIRSLNMTPLETKKPDGHCRFVCISDTCSKEPLCNIPDGDVLIVAGNFTTCGHPDEIRAFNDYIGMLPHKHKIVVPGEREVTLDETWLSRFHTYRRSRSVHGTRENSWKMAIRYAMLAKRISTTHEILTNCTLLCDSEVQVEGIRLYGMPWQPFAKDMGFNISDSQKFVEKLLTIPQGIHVLITHTPPLAYGDLNENGIRSGCAELLHSGVNRLKPMLHIYGEAFRGYGCYTNDSTVFINCCICDSEMNPRNQPVIYDLNLRNLGLHQNHSTPERQMRPLLQLDEQGEN